MDSRPEAGGLSRFTVSGETARMRLDQALARQFPTESRSSLQKLIAAGSVLVAGRPSSPSRRLEAGEEVSVAWPVPVPAMPAPEDIRLDILHEDPSILVLDKPAGLVVHPGAGRQGGTLVNALLNYDGAAFSELEEEEGERPGIVHRLDADTSGVMVVARTAGAAAFLKAAFKEHRVHKTYLAIVHGVFDGLGGVVEKPIGRHPRQRRKMAVVSDGGKYALTHYRVLESGTVASLLAVCIMTGRTHQIRVHLASIGHPVVGDRVYGGGRNLPPAFRRPGRQMLHAWQLELPHPDDNTPRTFTSPPPADFLDCLRQFNLIHHPSCRMFAPADEHPQTSP